MFGDYADCLSILTNYQTLESYISGSLEKRVFGKEPFSAPFCHREWTLSVFGQNLWLEKTHPGVRLAWVPALLPTLRIYDLEQVTNLHGLVSSYVKWGWLSPLWRIVMIRSERTCVRYAWNTVSGSCHHYSNRSKLAWSNPVTCETFSWIVAQNIFVVDVFFRHLFPYQSLLLTEFPVFTLLCSSRFCKRAFPRASFAFRIKGVLECVFWHEVKFIVS